MSIKNIFWSYGTIVGIICSALLYWGQKKMDKTISPSMLYDFSDSTLIIDVNQIIKDSKNIPNLDSFLNTFPDKSEREFLSSRILVKKNMDPCEIFIKNIPLSELLDLHLILKKKYTTKIRGNIKIEKNNWSDNEIMNILIMLLGFFFPTIVIGLSEDIKTKAKELSKSKEDLIKSLTDALAKWKEEEITAVRTSVDKEIVRLGTIVDKRFTETITSFTVAHNGFIHGMYGNYPHHYTKIFDESKSVFIKQKQGIKSAYVWMENVKPDDYTAFSMELLKLTELSVKSTSYYSNYEFLKLLKENKLDTWLKGVNKKKTENKDFKIMRVHIFNPDDESRKSDAFITLLKDQHYKEEKEKYKRLYFNNIIDKYEVWQLNGTIKFFGEYIIFDDQILLKYDPDFQTLVLLVGDIVIHYSESFDIEETEDNYFDITTKRAIINALNE